MRRDLPIGTVTFLFTDVEGSTRLLHELGDEAYAVALAEHRRVIREACTGRGGVEVDTQGDAFFFAFASAPGALAAASSFTDTLAAGPVHVRVGLHTGTPLVAEEGYVGHDVHLAARIAAAGHGGQVLVSDASRALLDGAALVSLGSHRLKDVAEPLTLWQLGEERFAPPATIATTNLPSPVSSFRGREQELAEAAALLTSTRLLTITGPGGAGKTRFAIELARRARDERFADYPAGVFACFLAPVREPGLVLGTIAQALSVREQAGENAFEVLASHLERRRLLLLVDNLEHLLDAAPELSRLLERCPKLTILATSRERLRVSGERAYALPPLDEQESVALFCDRSGVDPSATIGELCRQLEGLPLALELAAARLTVLTPDQLRERLGKRLDLLKGTRDADPRQQTLRATIEWSYDLLDAEEQRVFRCLSVFAGGCTLDAAEQVASADVDSLESLVDKSLLRFTEERYWMLETIREYAAEALELAGRTKHLRRAHGEHYVALAEEAERRLRGPEQSQWLTRVDAEHANAATAISFFLEGGAPAEALRICGALAPYWGRRGRVSEGRALVERALEHPAPSPDDVRAKALVAAGNLAYVQDNREAEQEFFTEALRLFRRVGDANGELLAEIELGWTTLVNDDPEGANASAERCVRRARALDDRWLSAYALRLQSAALSRLGRYEEAKRVGRDSAAIFEECGDSREHVASLSLLAWHAIVSEDYEEAALLLRESTSRTSAGDAEMLAIDQGNLGIVNVFLGNDEQAADDFVESLRHSVALGAQRLVAESLLGLAVLAARGSDAVGARRLRSASHALHAACGSPFNLPEERLEQLLQDRLGEPSDGEPPVAIDLESAAELATEVVSRLRTDSRRQPAST